MAIRVLLGWIGVNLAALLLLAVVDAFRVSLRRLSQLFGKAQPAEQRR